MIELLAAFREAAVGELLDRVDRLLAEQPFSTLAVSEEQLPTGCFVGSSRSGRFAATWSSPSCR